MIRVGDFLEVNKDSDYFRQKIGTKYKVVEIKCGMVYWEGLWGRLDTASMKVVLGRFTHIKCHRQMENK